MARGKLTLAAVAVVLTAAVIAHAAGTATVAWQELGRVNVATVTWTAATNSATVSATPGDYFRGELLRVVMADNGSVSNNYDVTLTARGIDLLNGQGANVTTGTAVQVSAAVALTDGASTTMTPVAVNDQITVGVDNVPASSSGTIYIYVGQ